MDQSRAFVTRDCCGELGGVQSEVPINRKEMKLSSPGDKARLKCFP